MGVGGNCLLLYGTIDVMCFPEGRQYGLLICHTEGSQRASSPVSGHAVQSIPQEAGISFLIIDEDFEQSSKVLT